MYRRNVRRIGALLAVALVLLGATTAAAQVTYGDDGLEVHGPNDRFSAVVGWRNQIRFTAPFSSPPEDANDFDADTSREFGLNRSRLKLE